jgi:hypothetical protein
MENTKRRSTMLGPVSVIRALALGLLMTGVACSSGSSPQEQTGGSPATGGKTSTGGTSATGGAATGGNANTGGATATGGTATGGARTGGNASTGGSATGGAQNSGGANATGGNATGGTVATGGGPIVDGGARTGGNANTGGATATGGAGPDAGVDLRPDTASPDTGSGSGYNPCPTSGACLILPLGDSITEGCCTAPMGGYRIELFHQTLLNKKKIDFVGSASNGPNTVDNVTFPKKHEGHGGYKISGIQGNITNSALTNYKPHIVLLMIGTNDINVGSPQPAADATRLGTLMDDITSRSPNTLLVVASIIPSKNDGTNSNFQKYNAAIPDLVDTRAKAGKHVVFIDNYKIFSSNSNYKTALLADNLHPNTAGYVVLGKAFYDLISAYLPASN